MRFIPILAVAIWALLAFGVACGGDEEEAQVAPSPASESERDAEEAEDEDEADEGDEADDQDEADDGDEADDQDEADDEDEAASTGLATPEEAVANFLADYGNGYAGDCAGTDPETDVGYYCSNFVEDRGDTQIYDAGLAFSEFGFWLLVERQDGDGWLVVDTAEVVVGPDEVEPPPW